MDSSSRPDLPCWVLQRDPSEYDVISLQEQPPPSCCSSTSSSRARVAPAPGQPQLRERAARESRGGRGRSSATPPSSLSEAFNRIWPSTNRDQAGSPMPPFQRQPTLRLSCQVQLRRHPAFAKMDRVRPATWMEVLLDAALSSRTSAWICRCQAGLRPNLLLQDVRVPDGGWGSPHPEGGLSLPAQALFSGGSILWFRRQGLLAHELADMPGSRTGR